MHVFYCFYGSSSDFLGLSIISCLHFCSFWKGNLNGCTFLIVLTEVPNVLVDFHVFKRVLLVDFWERNLDGRTFLVVLTEVHLNFCDFPCSPVAVLLLS